MLRAPIMKVVPCMVLLVMLATFLTPSFAWQTIATHDETEHALAHHHGGGTLPSHGEHDAGDHDDHDTDAHGAIGHLLGHLPAFHSTAFVVPAVPAVTSVFAHRATEWSPISLDPPLRPPRFL